VTGLGGRPRTFANRAVERARKAVTARIRDAVRRLDDVLPEAGAHLDRYVVTGVRCRYLGDQHWDVNC
jgi:enamine deaminase RidA (YjgF/YER057c/UK114 family)